MKAKIILSSAVASTFEWYDYALFLHFAPIIGEKFFPASDHSAVLLNAFLAFALGYIMRPLGGIFFGTIGDKFGRKIALSVSLMCMALPTAVIGLLPTYDSIGITASFCMIIARMLQGLSMGGAVTGSMSFLIEHTEYKNRGLVGSVPMSAICIGILLGDLSLHLVKWSMSAESFLDWGWRLPFIFGILVVYAGMYIRTHTDETPAFKKITHDHSVTSSPLRHVLRYYWREMFCSMAINATGSVLFYFLVAATINLLKQREFPEGDVDSLLTLCYTIMPFACLLFGKISDIIGRRKIYIFIMCTIFLSISEIIHILEYGNWGSVVVSQVVLALLASAYISPEPALQAELYPDAVRSTALSLSYNLAVCIFGGTAPLLMQFLTKYVGNASGCGYYIIAVCALSMIGLRFYKPQAITDEHSEVVSMA